MLHGVMTAWLMPSSEQRLAETHLRACIVLIHPILRGRHPVVDDTVQARVAVRSRTQQEKEMWEMMRLRMELKGKIND